MECANDNLRRNLHYIQRNKTRSCEVNRMRRILFAVAVTLVTGSAFSQSPPITLQADTLLDGRGKVLKNVSITVQDGRRGDAPGWLHHGAEHWCARRQGPARRHRTRSLARRAHPDRARLDYAGRNRLQERPAGKREVSVSQNSDSRPEADEQIVLLKASARTSVWSELLCVHDTLSVGHSSVSERPDIQR